VTPAGAAPDNRDLILEQFTRQAAPFAVSPSIRDEGLLRFAYPIAVLAAKRPA